MLRKVGRPRLCYDERSSSTKRRRTEELASNYSREALLRAAKLLSNPRTSETEQLQMTIDDHHGDGNYTDNSSQSNNILAMYGELRMTKIRYAKFRRHNEKITGNKSFPPYLVVAKAREECFMEGTEISDMGGSNHFISLLVHTVKRILLSLGKKKIEELRDKKLLLIGKWGMDGASGQQTTRQKSLSQQEA